MNILLITTGSAGDVYPFIALGRGLRARGHHVILLAPGGFRERVERAGLSFGLIEPDPGGEGFGRPKGLLPRIYDALTRLCARRWRKLARATTVVPLLRPVYEAIAARHAEGRTIVVASAPLLEARVAHDSLGVPLVTVHLAPVALRSELEPPYQPPLRLPPGSPRAARWGYRLVDRWVLDPLIAGPLNRQRRDLGLPPVLRPLHAWRHSPQLTLGLFPSWFAPPPADWPASLQLTGFLTHESDQPETVPADVEAFLNEGPPPILLTPGSAVHEAHRFFEESIRACVRLGRRALLVTPFRNQIPYPLPEGIRHSEYVPFAPLMPRVAALVHTGASARRRRPWPAHSPSSSCRSRTTSMITHAASGA